jgi:hypothetical protein
MSLSPARPMRRARVGAGTTAVGRMSTRDPFAVALIVMVTGFGPHLNVTAPAAQIQFGLSRRAGLFSLPG